MQFWQQSLAQAITDLDELLDIIEIDRTLHPQFIADKQFPLLVTREFTNRMQKGNAQDPLLLQVVPQQLEQQKQFGFIQDPLAETNITALPGLLHRYPGRVLLTLTGACPVHCRFCFRRFFPYADNNPLKTNLAKVLEYINNDDSIEEVIYSGGDPLLLNDRQLNHVSQKIAAIKHVQRLRIHTRVPIFLPSRINSSLLECLASLPLTTTVVIHCNHPQELDTEVIAALSQLQTVCQLLNQSVLLANINDDVTILAELSRKLLSAKVLPYYLHVLDPVAGAAHFNVSLNRAREIMQQLAGCLPGYLVPRLVKTMPDSRHKISLMSW